MKKIFLVSAFSLFIVAPCLHAQTPEQKLITNTSFTIKTDRHGIGELMKTGDVHATSYVRKGRVFGDVTVRYFHGRKLDTLQASANSHTDFSHDGKLVTSYKQGKGDEALHLTQSFSLSKDALTWNIKLDNTTATAIRIEDLAIPLIYNSGGGENPKEIFEERPWLRRATSPPRATKPCRISRSISAPSILPRMACCV